VRIDPAVAGLLAADGVLRVQVTMPPAVGIVCTGSEFNPAGEALPGKIFSSNDQLLQAALRSAGMEINEHVYRSIDTLDDIRKAIYLASLDSQVVITTGGVSVGEHDLVRAALERLGAEILFHGVLQKPGKPMLFARVGQMPVFALPGNPRAVLVAWYAFVLPFLRAVEGDRDPGPRTAHLPIARGLTLKGNRAEFRAASVRDGVVHLLTDEGSHLLGSLVGADALAYFPHTTRQVPEGATVEVHYLPKP
jgi:molybdopterin molybdotransferase